MSILYRIYRTQNVFLGKQIIRFKLYNHLYNDNITKKCEPIYNLVKLLLVTSLYHQRETPQ